MSTIELSLDEIEQLTRSAFEKNGCNTDNVEALTQTVVTAERDKAISHGLFRVPGYIASLRSGKVNGQSKPIVEQTTQAFINVDADYGYAPLALARGIPRLAEAAQSLGIATMTVNNTYHFAALWPETEALAERELIGIACVCHTPTVTPFGGNKALFGTNPVAFAWPRPGQPPVSLDMATSAMAQGEIQIAARDGNTLPDETGLDKDGNPSNDPDKVLEGLLLPFGGYKGSALALMVELLSAGATGDAFSFEAEAKDNGDGGPAKGGEFIIAISPKVLAGEDWASHCGTFFEQYKKINGARIPGSKRHEARNDKSKRKINKELVQEIETLTNT